MENVTYETFNRRMLRVMGHLESTIRMVENKRDMYDILIQVSAVEGAIKSLHKSMLTEYTNELLVEKQLPAKKSMSKVNTCIQQIFK